MTDPPATPDRPAPGRLAVAVLGAGRVGAVLGAALRAAGHRVVAVTAVSEASRSRAETLLPGVPVLPPDEAARAGDLVLLAVPDDALAGLVAGLAATGALRPGQLLAHTSGRHGLDVLAPAAAVGALGLALHPVMTFTGTSLDIGRLAGACFGVTAPAALLPVAQALVLEMGGDPVVVDDTARELYHAGLAHGANHLVTLVGQAADALAAAGVAEPERLLRPLLLAALDNALTVGDRALTGPVARGDAGTVADHLAALQQLPEVRASYAALARATVGRARRAGLLRPDQAAAVLAVLADLPREPGGGADDGTAAAGG